MELDRRFMKPLEVMEDVAAAELFLKVDLDLQEQVLKVETEVLVDFIETDTPLVEAEVF